MKKHESENQFDIANEIFIQINDLKKIEQNKIYTDVKLRQAKQVN